MPFSVVNLLPLSSSPLRIEQAFTHTPPNTTTTHHTNALELPIFLCKRERSPPPPQARKGIGAGWESRGGWGKSGRERGKEKEELTQARSIMNTSLQRPPRTPPPPIGGQARSLEQPRRERGRREGEERGEGRERGTRRRWLVGRGVWFSTKLFVTRGKTKQTE